MDTQFKKNYKNLRIELIANGYIVYPNENYKSLNANIAEIPFVFETKENLFKFIEDNFKILI